MDPRGHKPAGKSASSGKAADAVRISAAGVAAQQAARQRQLDEREAALKQRRLRLNGDAELARQHIRETWGKLRQAQFRWKHRRGLERAALRVRGRDLETAAQRIDVVRAQLEADQRGWQTQRQALELELDGVNEPSH